MAWETTDPSHATTFLRNNPDEPPKEWFESVTRYLLFGAAAAPLAGADAARAETVDADGDDFDQSSFLAMNGHSARRSRIQLQTRGADIPTRHVTVTHER